MLLCRVRFASQNAVSGLSSDHNDHDLHSAITRAAAGLSLCLFEPRFVELLGFSLLPGTINLLLHICTNRAVWVGSFTTSADDSDVQPVCPHLPSLIIVSVSAISMSLHSFANCLRQFSRLSRFPMSSASVLPRVLSMPLRWYSAHRMPAEDATGSSKRKKVTINTLQSMYRERQPISALTAYDYPGAALADAAGIDIVLCGDSLAMVVLGHEDTSRLTLEEMLMHCRAVARGSKSCFLV